MFRIDLLPGAHTDFNQAFDWYASRSNSVAVRFTDAINNGFDEIAHDPERFTRIDERHYERLIKRFPFRIIYRIVEQHLVIVAIAHAKRNPGYWLSR